MINTIIERLKEKHRKNGVYGAFKGACDGYSRSKQFSDWQFARGILWGLLATDFITEEELNKALCVLEK